MPPRPVLGGLDESLSQPPVHTAPGSLHIATAPPPGPPPCQIRTGWAGAGGPGGLWAAIRGLSCTGLGALGAVGRGLPLALPSVAECPLRACIHTFRDVKDCPKSHFR